ncbi:5-methyltetrahydropteroyltriglutamate--homocysteine S-methyltransferase [Pelagibacterium xiamenense]|uniref:5-methyltetrahydropteroyltriglutamate-- homocysteine S-methyltransferase n=1 Tax=Pelagibacterium xiamenense TaxID=2901140 RepID=UPI001E3E9158|nr:5-methyltetrahydropteroyltriglutamate--homocysteine S-methyltransferase [Pelagibacterium xiamenense]MCD7060202.1 5-methyltetrahydropteroyltriglutamate--homocysteine S-methyltransferase [Pelagibacterium xiamenense]
MTVSANLGFPRIGAHRELKKALETYWKGETGISDLSATAAQLRARHWHLQKEAGIDVIPSNDFSLYDHVLDTSVLFGAIPRRFEPLRDGDPLTLYFACARGTADAPAMEMTKWFDTNYHYIVPEFTRDQDFALASRKPIDEYLEARAQGIETRPVVLGPVTWLSLGKSRDDGLDPIDLLDKALPAYAELLAALKATGAQSVQIDEPVLSLDLTDKQRAAFVKAYEVFAAVAPDIMLATYFGPLGDNLPLAVNLPVAGLHIDLARAPEQLEDVLAATRTRNTVLSLGLIDGRNIWRADLAEKFRLVRRAWDLVGPDRLQIAPSCSLLHSPVDLELETALDDEFRSWLAFAKQKLGEVQALTLAIQRGESAAREAFSASKSAIASRTASPRTTNQSVRRRVAAIRPDDLRRDNPYAIRQQKQADRFGLPLFPTTTIGSFPQTQEVRKARAAHKRGELDTAGYDAFLKQETERSVRIQEELGLDVLVHGEFERNDMVEYFGEQLDGFAFTKNGWVQSYGSRCVKPPVIYGDVSRPGPMTVTWSAYAQSLTKKPMKGMLTGPVTILQWSFVRDDQPRSETCRQIGLAIRDEVLDLEEAGIGMIQIDEPALREGLPLRRKDWQAYLDWAVDCFRLAASGVADRTQIHTHMCYAEFNDIMEAIAALDADVISIETSRSDMELLDAFRVFAYPNEIGPGVWDIHSPRVPGQTDMEALLKKALAAIPARRLWVNPDCGLKTRDWPEVKASLEHLVAAAATLRASAA